MAEDFYIDEFDLTPDSDVLKTKEAEAELSTEKESEEQRKARLATKEKIFQENIRQKIKQSKTEKPTTSEKVTNILFGPDIELAGDSFLTSGKLARNIKKQFTGEEYESGDVDPFTGFVAGVIDGTIKIPYGLVNLTTEIYDWLNSDGIKTDQGLTAKVEKYFSNSVLGKIQQGAEDTVKESAIGQLTSALTQMYSAGRAGASLATKAVEGANKIYAKFSKAAKLNKAVKARPDAVKAALVAKDYNKANKYAKYAAVTFGGGYGASIIADVEDIGTWGDWAGGPSSLDREQREEADDDAARRLFNRFKFGSENALVSVPIAYGVNKIAQKIAKFGKELKYSDDQLDQWVNKWIVEPFVPSGNKPQFMFEGMKRVEGELAAGQLTARDLIVDIDKTLFNIAKESGITTKNPAWKRLVGRLDELLTSTDDVVENGKIVFKGFDDAKINQFNEFIKEIGLTQKQADRLIGEMFKVRNQFNVFKNTFVSEAKGSLNVSNKEFMEIMSNRMRNIFNSEYKIITDRNNKVFTFLNYKPSQSAIDEVKAVFKRYGAKNGITLSDEHLDRIIDDVINNIQYNPITQTPEFPLTILSALDDKAAQLINIADNVKGFNFKPTSLIQSEKDLRAFQRFFGQKRDLRNTIINTMMDLSNIVAKNRFYNNILKESENLIQNGQRAVVYPTRLQAVTNLRNQKIIADKNGLNLKGPLGESAYTNPLNGQFTSQELKDALQFSEKLMSDNIAKNVVYQHLFLIPKGLTQISKTILGPFTHTRNFITASQFALGTGNLFKNPIKIVQNFRQAFNTIQPQLLYRNLPKDQALYKFLLEEQVVSSSASARDIAGLLDDIGSGGDVYMKFFGRFGKGMKKIYEKAGDLYVAEDDIWKVYNFLSEFDTYTNAYKNAFDKGLIKTMPTKLEVMKEAANIVRNTVPNYNYVGTFAQNARRSPVGNFISFPIEVTRTAANIAELGLKEARNPIFKNVGYKRLFGLGTATAAAPVVVGGLLSGLYGVTKGTVSAIRELITPDFSEDSTLFVYRDKEGNLKYIDGSGALVYDTVVNPIQAVIANINREDTFNPNSPLTVGLMKGFISAAGRFLRPYVDESIWLNVFNNILIRKGRTADGRQLWNPEDSTSNKLFAALKHALIEVAPLSAKQLERMKYAIQDKPGPRGEKYDVNDELAGLYGLRPLKVEPVKALNYKLNDFKAGLRNSRSLFTAKVLKGGEITPDEIIQAFYYANKQRYNVFNKMKRKLEAARHLDANEDEIKDLFERRQEKKNFKKLNNFEFQPFSLTDRVVEEAGRQEELLLSNFDNISNAGISKDVQNILKEMSKVMEEIPLGEKFEDYININDFLIGKQSALPAKNQVAGGEMPMPSQQVVQPQPQQFATATGLTPTENALLSEEEKQIRLRQRGFTNYG